MPGSSRALCVPRLCRCCAWRVAHLSGERFVLGREPNDACLGRPGPRALHGALSSRGLVAALCACACVWLALPFVVCPVRVWDGGLWLAASIRRMRRCISRPWRRHECTEGRGWAGGWVGGVGLSWGLEVGGQTRASALAACTRILKWIKKEEQSLFITPQMW